MQVSLSPGLYHTISSREAKSVKDRSILTQPFGSETLVCKRFYFLPSLLGVLLKPCFLCPHLQKVNKDRTFSLSASHRGMIFPFRLIVPILLSFRDQAKYIFFTNQSEILYFQILKMVHFCVEVCFMDSFMLFIICRLLKGLLFSF